jgi:hypothetical protein
LRARAAVLLAVVLAAEAACRPAPSLPIKLDMAGVSAFPAGLFTEIVVANFRDEAPSPDFAFSRELQSYLAAELDRSFGGPVSLLNVSWADGASLDDPGYWKRAAGGRERAVILAGSARLVGQIRKALQKSTRPIDGPFKLDDRAFLEYRHFLLSVDLVVRSAATGEPLYRKTYLEEKDYTDLEQTFEFAFSELAARFRARLFPVLLGTPTAEERLLLRR